MKIFFGLILVLVLLMGGYLVRSLWSAGSDITSEVPRGNNVSIVDGQQIITLSAKGGYLPGVSVAKAGIPTILRVETKGTFDCSSAIRIPSLKVAKNLPATGSTDLALGSLESGTIQGNCGMGMYPFQINVEN